MISIDFNGERADMPPSASTRFETGGNALDFDGLPASITAQMQLPPTARNLRLSGHAHRPWATAPFAALEATLEWKGLAIARGEFAFTSSQRAKGPSGFFRSDAGAIAGRKDESIGSILAGLAFPFSTNSQYSTAYTALEADIVLPKMMGRRMHPNFVGVSEPIEVNDGVPWHAPCFKAMHVLEEVFNALGYSPRFIAPDNFLKRLILFPKRLLFLNQVGTFNFSYSDYLPDLTLSQLISLMRKTGTAIDIDSRLKEAWIMPLDAAMLREDGLDLTYAASPEPEVEQAFAPGQSAFAFAIEAEGVPNIPNAVLFAGLPSGAVGDIAFVEAEGRLYQKKTFGMELASYEEWAQLGGSQHAGTAEGGGQEVKAEAIPCPAAKTFHFRCTGRRIRAKGNGYIIAGPFPRELGNGYEYRVLKPDDFNDMSWKPEILPRTNNWVELAIPYTEDHDDAEIEIRVATGRLMPDFDYTKGPQMGLYHGMQADDSLAQYAYAGPSGWMPDGSARLIGQDISWESILSTRMATAKKVLEAGRLATYRLRPKAHDAIAFRPLRPVLIDGARLLPKSLELTLGSGPLEGEFEGWVVQ